MRKINPTSEININTQNIISSLFLLGFDKLDPFIITATISNITINLRENKEVQLKNGEEYSTYEIKFTSDDKISKSFEKIVDMDFITKLKDGFTMDTDIAKIINLNNISMTVKQYLNTNNNRLLVQYIKENIDLRKIILEKISAYQQTNPDYIKEAFSNKEKIMIMEIFGLNDIFRELHKQSNAVNQMLYNKENNDIDNAIQTLERIRKKNK